MHYAERGTRAALLFLGLAVGVRAWQLQGRADGRLRPSLPGHLLASDGQICRRWGEAEPPLADRGKPHQLPRLTCWPPQYGQAAAQASLSPAARLTLGLRLPINCCQASDLTRLAFIHRRAAEALVAEREGAGPYADANDLRRARHIGRQTAARLADWVDFAWPCAPVLPAQSSLPPGSALPAAQAAAQAAGWQPAAAWATAAGVQRAWLVHVLRYLPANALSRAWGWLTRVRRPVFFAAWLKQTFVAATGIDMAEAAAPIDSYPCLEDLFVRALKPGARPIEADPQLVVSPTDSRVGAHGIVTEGTLYQIKGHTYRLAELLSDEERARQFEGGAYMTLYLSPRDYHRIHSPAGGHVTAAQTIPGRLLPVFPAALTQDGELLARNERIVTYLRSIDASEIALVAVGATLVGRMRMAYDPSLRGNVADAHPRKVRYPKPVWLERGEELGAFELGSTVVLLCQRDKVVFDELPAGTRVRMGQRIGRASRAPRGRAVGGAPSVVYRQETDPDDPGNG